MQPPGGQDAWRQWGQMWQQAMAGWASATPFAQMMMPGGNADESRALLDPVEWAKRSSGLFDAGIAQLTEGPAFATMWDLDRKILNAQKLWIQRNKDIAAYMQLVQGAWKIAGERFEKALQDPAGAPLTTGRNVLDEWIAIANEALLEMHRSPEFLEAQRRMTRSAADYRLQERAIAEVFCDMHHIPTRTEMDEVQRTVYELRRELRALRRDGATPAHAPVKPAAQRGAKRAAVKRAGVKSAPVKSAPVKSVAPRRARKS
jgi:polyhydroxyalkanoate synthesis regulator phasin